MTARFSLIPGKRAVIDRAYNRDVVKYGRSQAAFKV